MLLYLLAFFIPYSEALKTRIGPTEVSAPYILAGVGLAALLAVRAAQPRPRLVLWRPMLVFFLVYAGVSLLHLVVRQAGGLGRADYEARLIEQIGRLMLSLVIAAYVMNVVADRRSFERVFGIVSATAGVVSAYGIYQVVGTFLGFYRPLLPHTASYGLAPGQIGANRAVATMKEPSYFAGFLVFSMTITLSLLASRDVRARVRIALGVSLALQAVAMLLTTSTGGFAGLVAATAAFLLLTRGDVRRRAAGFVVALAVCCAPAGIWLYTTFASFRGQLVAGVLRKAATVSALERATFIGSAVGMFADHPLVGVGPGNYGNHLRAYTAMFNRADLIANNVYVEVLCEAGIFAFIAFMAMVAALLIGGYGAWRLSAEDSPIAAALLSALVGTLVQFLAYPTFKMEFTWLLFGLLVAHGRLAAAGRDG